MAGYITKYGNIGVGFSLDINGFEITNLNCMLPTKGACYMGAVPIFFQ